VNFKNGYGKDYYFSNSNRAMYRTIAGLSLRKVRFNPLPVYVGTVANELALAEAFL